MQILKEKSGTYAFRVETGRNPKTGRRQQKYRGGFRREKDAIAAAQKAEEAIRANQYVHDSRVTFADCAEDWLRAYREQAKESSARVRHHEIGILLPYLGQLLMQEITPRAYESAMFTICRRYARNTASGVHGTARMIFKRARRYALVGTDPTEFFTQPREKQKIQTLEEELPQYLEKEELSRFLSAAQASGLDGDYPLFTLLSYTGLRIGEALALTWDDVSYKNHTIRINKTLFNPTNNRKQYQLTSPKTKRSNRIIPIDDHTEAVLVAWQAEIDKIRGMYEDDYHTPAICSRGFVFPSLRYPGCPRTARAVQLRIDRLSKIMNPPPAVRIHPHLFRHTHVSLLAEAGVGLEQIQERLGHADDDTTRSIYLHLTKHLKKDAALRFADLMKSVKKQ